jgi:transcriptional regulator with XRE-family HTH domain
MVVSGGTLKNLRERRGWDRVTAAQHYGLTRRMVAALEQGTRQPSAIVAQRLAAVLGVELDDILEVPA